MVGDAKSIVSDAAESKTKAAKFLVFVFIQYGFYDVSSGISKYESSAPARREAKFLHSLLNLQMRFWVASPRNGVIDLR
jgi:hypothetical protein